MGAPRRVVIIGLGLMGGSLARALKRAGDTIHIRALTSERDAIEQALHDGAIDAAVENVGQAFADADVIVYATPIATTLELLEAHAPLLHGASAAITDAGSVKPPLSRRPWRSGVSPVRIEAWDGVVSGACATDCRKAS